MKRTPRSALPVVVALLALASASTAAASDGSGPFGVTVVAAPTAPVVRVGALIVGGRRFCTASVVHSPRRDLVATAAHCMRGSAVDVGFAPGYRNGRTPYGVWKVGRWFVSRGWADGRDEDSDVAFAVVERRDGEAVEDAVGGNRFMAGTATGATAVTLTGYPNSRAVPISCTNKPRPHSRTQQRIACPGFSGGTSGSPWVNGDGQVVGVLGGHEGGGATVDVSYSVVFRAEAAALYRKAAGCGPSQMGSS
ncbi:trypsin-like peptidase domain-containing protein [Streptomyces sp. DG2A-72]|uniref:trypsin-like serine peptidase n=1 Tax=Streptomyces sp. DG2A-72 TaxID=3051386 RepID=UPI00265C7AA2|nr:trypsin-like peptidase domain-containing protein [Streptomyces sp. DG2A-72]MDO0934309.1 trypsin-like peptidase domain-containing protein [Streptomyces sp. DG2A-72]